MSDDPIKDLNRRFGLTLLDRYMEALPGNVFLPTAPCCICESQRTRPTTRASKRAKIAAELDTVFAQVQACAVVC